MTSELAIIAFMIIGMFVLVAFGLYCLKEGRELAEKRNEKGDRTTKKRLIALISKIVPSPEAKKRIWENIKQELKEGTK